MTVAVKYCGGCNPRFDRTNLVERLRRALPAVIGGADLPDPDVALVVCGCHCRCGDHGPLSGRYGKWVVSSPEDFDAAFRFFAARIESINETVLK